MICTGSLALTKLLFACGVVLRTPRTAFLAHTEPHFHQPHPFSQSGMAPLGELTSLKEKDEFTHVYQLTSCYGEELTSGIPRIYRSSCDVHGVQDETR